MSPLVVTYAAVVAKGSAARRLSEAKKEGVLVCVSRNESSILNENLVDNQTLRHVNAYSNSVDRGCSKFLGELQQCLHLEAKFHDSPSPISSSCVAGCVSAAVEGSITSGMRDGSSHVLRCLKVWYDLPSDIFFNSVSSIDKFLSKMKAQPKHLSCIAVSAFHLACVQYQQLQKKTNPRVFDELTIPDPTDLVNISQSRCSPSDLLRMKAILSSKLELNPGAGPESPITALSFLRLMFATARAAANRLGLHELLPVSILSNEEIPESLLSQLEILACDSNTLRFRPAEIALALLATDFQRRAAQRPENTNALMGIINELQKYCKLHSGSFMDCMEVVVELLKKYNDECTVAHRQRLIWKLSNRTMRHLRPTQKLGPILPTIIESVQPSYNCVSSDDCNDHSYSQRSRNDSGYGCQWMETENGDSSSEMEEEEPSLHDG